MMVHGRSESIFGTEDRSMKYEPGTSFANGSMGYIVLEDGSITEIKEASYRKLLKMLDGNKVYTKDILNSIPEEQPNLLIKEDVDIEFHSVHDIVLDIVYDENNKLKKLVKKRLSFATIGEDVIFNDAWRTNTDGSKNPKVSLNTIFSDIMSASFSLDEYFDKEDSSKKLLMDEEYKVDTVVLRLRKMNNPVSETDPEKFVNVLLTGTGVLEILSKLKADMSKLNSFSKVYVENTYNDGTIDSNFISFTTKGDLLRFTFDEYNNDLTVDVDTTNSIIKLKHRFFGIIETNNVVEPGSIYMTKSITMNSNGHITTMVRTDLEINKEINSLYYTKKQIDDKYIGDTEDPEEMQVFTGSLSVNDLTVEGDVEFKDGYEVSKDSSIVVMNSTNTSIDDPIVVVGTGNTNGEAPSVGAIFNVYRALETWDDNILTGSVFTSEGAVYGLTGDNMNIVISKDIKNYLPKYYTSDPSLNNTYYVTDAFLELKPSKVNMLLALANEDKVNYHAATKYYGRLRMYMNNILNANIADIEVKGILQYKSSGSLEYKDFSSHVFGYQDTSLKQIDVFNTYDVDKVRLRIFIKVKKGVVDALNKNDIFFSLQQLAIFGYDPDNFKLDGNTTPMYADRYYSEDTLSKASYINISNGNQPQSIKNLDDISLNSTLVNIDSSKTILYNSKNCHMMLMESLIGESNIVSRDSKMKLIRVRGLFTPGSATYEESDATQRRSDLGVLPSIRNYKAVLKVYTCMYSDLVISLGTTETKTDEFGKSVTVETQTVTKELTLTEDNLLTTKLLNLQNMSTYGSIDEIVEIDMSSIIHKTADMVEYFTGKYRNDSIHIGFALELIKDSLIDKYDEYGDSMSITKFSVKIYDILKEFRGTTRDVVVDADAYSDIPVMFLDTDWNTHSNVLSESTIMNSTGITNMIYDDKFRLRVTKPGGADYSVYNWTDIPDQYDHRTYMLAFRFKKGINNLIKAELRLADILSNGVSIDSILNAKCYVVLFIVNSDGTYTNIVPYKNSRLDGDTGTTNEIVPKRINTAANKNIAELRRMAKFITHQTVDKYETFKLNDDVKLYYDLNSFTDDIILELDIFIDIPINNKQNISSLDVVFSKMSLKMMSNLAHRMRLVQEMSSMRSVIFDKERNKIRFIDNKFDNENTALNINHLGHLDTNTIRGFIENVQGLENDLVIKFLKDIEGEFTISDTNDTLKRVPMTMKDATTSEYGLIGILTDFNREMEVDEFNPSTTYSAQALYRIVAFLHKLLNNKEIGIENSSQDRIATARAIFNLHAYYQATVSAVSAAWSAESIRRRAENTIVKDLLHFEQWDMVSAIGGLHVAGSEFDKNSLWIRAISEFNDQLLVLERKDGSARLGKFDPSLLYISAPQAMAAPTDVIGGFWWDGQDMPSGVVIAYSCNAVSGYNFNGIKAIDYSQYSEKMNRQKAADPYFLMHGTERRDGNTLYCNRKAMIGGAPYIPYYANNNRHGLQHVSRSVLLDSADTGPLKTIYIPEFTTSDYIEYIHCISPRLEAVSSRFTGDQDYVNQTCGDDFSMNYQSRHNPGVSARGLLYGGPLAGGGGYHNINFVPPFYTQFRFIIQSSSDNGSSWSDLASFVGRFFSLESYLNKSVKENYVDCAVEKRYRVVLDILHEPLDIDSYGGAMTVGRMGELNGGFAESRWSYLEAIPHRVGSKHQNKHPYGKNMFRRLKVKYIKHYLEPWQQPQEYLMTGDIATDNFYGYNCYIYYIYEYNNYSGESTTVYLQNGKSDVPIVLYNDATSFMKRNYTPLIAPGGLMYYNFRDGSYWLADGFATIPLGVTKIIPIPNQAIRDALYSYTYHSHHEICSFMINIELRRGSVHPRNEQEAMTTGTVVRSWNYVMTRTRDLDINKSVIPDADDVMNIDPNYRYWYHLKWGKNGIWVDGINLAGQTGIVRRYNSWDSTTVFGFYKIAMKHKYYIYK